MKRLYYFGAVALVFALAGTAYVLFAPTHTERHAVALAPTHIGLGQGVAACGSSGVQPPTALSASCDPTTHIATFNWTPDPNSSYSLLRVNDTSYGWTGLCGTDLVLGNWCWSGITSPMVVTGLYGTYSWWVHSCDSSGTCSDAAFPTPTTISCTPAAPAAPTGLSGGSCAANGSSITSLSWGAVANAAQYNVLVTSPSPITCSTFGAGWAQSGPSGCTMTLNSTATPSIASTPGQTYYWSVSAADLAGTSAATVGAAIVCPGPPPSPTGLGVSCGTSGTSATLSWQPSAGATAYSVFISPIGGVCPSTWTVSGPWCQSPTTGSTSITPNISAATNYSWGLSAGNAIGWSSSVNYNGGGTFSCPASTNVPPPAPTGLSGSCAANGQSISNLSWGITSGATAYLAWIASPYTNFTCPSGWTQNGPNGCTAILSGNTSVAAPSFASIPGATYLWGVYAANAYGNSPDSIFGSPVVCGLVPPRLVATCSADATQVTLSWPTVAGATGYYPRIESTVITSPSCTSNAGWTFLTHVPPLCFQNNTPGTSFVFGVTPNTSYTAWVEVANANSVSTLNEIATNQTTFTCVPAPTSGTITGTGCTLGNNGVPGACPILLSWTSVNTANGLVDVTFVPPGGTESVWWTGAPGSITNLIATSTITGNFKYIIHNHNTMQSLATTTVTVSPNAMCGTASGTIVASQPTTNLCVSGKIPSMVGGTGPWTWGCAGSGTIDWQSSTGTATPVSYAPSGGLTLLSGDTASVDPTNLSTPQVRIRLQGDGNLVLLNPSGGAYGGLGTANAGCATLHACSATFQPNGTLVLKVGSTPYFTSGGSPGDMLSFSTTAPYFRIVHTTLPLAACTAYVSPTVSCYSTPATTVINSPAVWTAVASGGNGVYAYNWTGLFTAASRLVSYTPLTTGAKTATVNVTSAGATSANATCSLGVNGALSVTCAAPQVTAGQTGTWTATPSGGVPPISYTWSGSVSGAGNPKTLSYATPGIFSSTVTATDSLGNTATNSCTLGVSPVAPVLSSATCNSSGAATLTWGAVSGANQYQATIHMPSAGGCPTGWGPWGSDTTYCIKIINAPTVTITTGTPNFPLVNGYTATVYAYNTAGNAWSPVSNSIPFFCGQPTVSCSTLPTTVTAGTPVTWTATAGGGTGTFSYNWAGSDDGMTGSGSGSGTTNTNTHTYTPSSPTLYTARVVATSNGVSSPQNSCQVQVNCAGSGGCQSAANICGQYSSGNYNCAGQCLSGGVPVSVPPITGCSASITITATPAQVPAGGGSVVNWSGTYVKTKPGNGNVDSCTLTSSAGGGVLQSSSGSGLTYTTGSTNYTVSAGSVNGKTTYTATCVGLDGVSKSASVTVGPVPKYQEQ